MNSQSYFPHYFAVDDIFVTQERVQCEVLTKVVKMGFLDPESEGDDLEPGKIINLPLWYVKELRPNNPYFRIIVPNLYKNVHKAICEAESTLIELGKLHPYFYEYGRYLIPYDRHQIIGRIVFEICRQRVRHLLDITKNTLDNDKPEQRLEKIEIHLYEIGVRTNTLFTKWLQMKGTNISASEFVQERAKKRKRNMEIDEEASTSFSQPI